MTDLIYRTAIELLKFADACNYRGCLEAKAEGGKFFWRVGCDLDDEDWHEIPEYLYEALKRYRTDKP